MAEFGPKRIIDTPISELGFTAIGVGAAMNGLRPIVEFMTWNFAVLASDQIINHAAKMLQMSGGQFHIPIVFRGGNGSPGQLAATHSQSYEAFYANIPGLKVITVSNPYDATGLLKDAIRDDDPVLFLESEKMYGDKGEIPDGEYLLPIGVADVKREGKDVTVVTYGACCRIVMDAADKLSKVGIDVEVIDVQSLMPFDIHVQIVESSKKTNRILFVDEDVPGGATAYMMQEVIEKQGGYFHLDSPARTLSAKAHRPAYSAGSWPDRVNVSILRALWTRLTSLPVAYAHRQGL